MKYEKIVAARNMRAIKSGCYLFAGKTLFCFLPFICVSSTVGSTFLGTTMQITHDNITNNYKPLSFIGLSTIIGGPIIVTGGFGYVTYVCFKRGYNHGVKAYKLYNRGIKVLGKQIKKE